MNTLNYIRQSVISQANGARHFFALCLILCSSFSSVLGQKLLDANASGGPLTNVVASASNANSSVASAFSIRQLKTTYDHPTLITPPAAVSGFTNSTQPLVRVLRSSDNGELDIGYDGSGNLDTLTLKNFVTNNGANPTANGFVTVWYDQSGNSRDVYPPTAAARLRIVNAGVVERNSGGQIGLVGVSGGMVEYRPSASTTFNGTSGANIYGISGDRTMNVVSQPRAYTNGGSGDGSGTYLIDRYGDPVTANGGTPSGFDNPLTSLKAVGGNWALQLRLQDGTGIDNSIGGSVAISTSRSDNVMAVRLNDDYYLYVNGVLAGSVNLPGDNPMAPVRIGYGSNTSETVYYGEFILFPSALSGGDLNTLNVNQTDYFVLGPPANQWAGTTSTNWGTASNWSNGTVPDNLSSVTIPSGTTFAPTISSAVSIKKLTMASGATVTVNSTLTLSDSLIVNGTLAGTGTVVMGGGVRQVITGTTSPINFTNLTISNTANQVVLNNNINVSGTLTVNANATLVPGAAVVINSAATQGTLTGSGTIHVTRTTATADYQNQYRFTTSTLTGLTVNYAGTGNQTINLSTNHGNVTVSGSGTKTLSAAVTTTNITGNLLVTAATLDNGGFAIVGNGTRTFSVSNGATFRLSGTTSAFPTGFGTVTLGTSSTVEYAGSGTQTITAVNYGNLVSSNTGARTLANTGTIGIAGSFTPGTNVYTNTSSTISYNGTGAQTVRAFNYNNLTIAGTRTGSPVITLESGTVDVATTLSITATGVGSYSVTGNTVSYSGAGQTVVSNITYNNLTLGGTGTKSTTGVTVNGILSLEGTTATMSVTPTFGADATLQFNKTAAFTANTIDWPATFSGNGGVIVRSSATTTLSNNTRNIVYDLRIETGSVVNLGPPTAHTCGYLYLSGVNQVATGSYGGTGSGANNINATFLTSPAANQGRITTQAKTWTGTTSTDWGTGSNWAPSGTPTTANIVTIPSGVVNSPTVSSAQTCLDLVLASGASLTVSSGQTLTIAGNCINEGGTISGTGTIAFSGTSRTISGIGIAFPNININDGATITLNSNSSCSSLTFPGTGSVNPSSLTHGSGFTLTVNGNVNINNPANNDDRDWNINAGAAVVTGNVNIGSASTSTNTRRARIFLTTGTLSVTGNLIFNLGSGGVATNAVLNLSGGAARVNIGGALTISNNLGTLTPGTTSTISFNSSANQTIPVGVSAVTYNDIVVNTTATATLSAAISATNVTGNLVINAGTLSNGGFAIVGNASKLLQVDSAARLTLSGTTAFPTGFGTFTLSDFSTIEYTGTAAQAITARTYGNLTISGSRAGNSVTLPNGSNLIINGTFTPSATFGAGNYIITGSTLIFNGTGTQTIPAFNYNNITSSASGPRVLASSGTIGIAGVFTPGSNTYTTTGSTVNFNGAGSQTIPAFSYQNLTSSSTGARTLASVGTIGVSGTFTPGTNTYTITGSTIDFNGTGAQTIPAFSYNNITVSSARTGSPSVTLSGAVNIAGNFTLSATGVGSYVTTGSTVNYNGTGAQTVVAINYNNVTVSGTRTGSPAITLASGTIGVAGTFTASATGIGSFITTGNTVDFNGTGAQTIPAFTYNNITLSTARTGSPAITLSGTINVAGNFAVTATGVGSYVNTGSTVNYNGTGAQSVAPINYNNLTISGTRTGSPTITLASGTIGVAGTFTASATGIGAFVTTGNTVDFNATGAQTIPVFTYNNITLSGTRTGSPAITLGSGTINVAGNFALTATGVGSYVVTGNTVDYNGSGAQSVAPINYNNITISGARSGSPAITLASGTIGVAGNFTLSATGIGSYVTTGNTVNYNGAGAQSVAPINYNNLTISGARTGSPTITLASGTTGVAGTLTISATGVGSYTTTGNTVDFNGTGAQTIPAFSYNNITLSGARSGSPAITLSGTINVTGDFTLSATGVGSYVNTGSTVNYNGTGAQSVAPINYNNLTISGARTGSPTVTLASGTIGVAGTFTASATGIGAFVTTGNTVDFNATGAQTIPVFTYNNITLSGTRTGSPAITLGSGTINVAGNFSLTATGVGSYVVTGNTVDYNGSGAQSVAPINYNNVTISGARSGSPAITLASGTIGVAGNFTLSATGVGSYVNTGNTVNYNGAGAQSVAPVNYNNLTISGARTGSPTITLASGTTGVASTLTISATGVGSYTTTGNTVDFNGTGAQTIPAFTYNNITLSNARTGSPAITLSGTINVVGNFAVTATGIGSYVNTGSTVNYNGTGAQSVAPISYNNLTISGARTGSPTITLASGTVGVAGTLTVSATGVGAYTLTGNTIDFNGSGSQTIPAFNYNNLTSSNSGARVLANSGTIGIAGIFTPGTNSYTVTGSTIDYNGTGAQTIAAATYNNLTLSGARTGSPAITLASGTISVGGTVTMSATGVGSYVTTGNTFTYAGGASQTIIPINYNNITSSGAGARVLSSSGTIGIAGTFTPGTNSYTVTGSTIDFNGTGAQTIPAFSYNNITLSGTRSGSPNITLSGTINVAGSFAVSATGVGSYINTGSTVNYNGTGSQTIAPIDYNNLTFSGARIGSPAIIMVAGTYGIAGAFTLSTTGLGSYINSGSTFNYNGSGSQTITQFLYHNLSVTGSRTSAVITFPAGSIGIMGNFSYTATGVSTLTTLNNTIDYNGSGSQTIGAFTYNNISISGDKSGGVITLEPGTITIPGTFTHSATNIGSYVTTGNTINYSGSVAQTVVPITYGNLTLSGVGIKTLGGDITVEGDLIVGGTSGLDAANYNVTVLGNWINNASLTASTSNIVFSGTSSQIMQGSVVPVFNNVTINNASGVTMNAPITINGALTISSGKLAIGTNTLTVNGTISTTTTNCLTANGSSALAFTGSGNATVHLDQTTPGTTNRLGTLTVNRAGNTITLGSDVQVSSALNLTNGKLAIGSNQLTINGTLSSTTTNCLVADGSSSLSIGGSGALGSSLFFDQTTSGTTNRIQQLTYNRSSQTITLGNALQVTGTVTPTAGTLASGGNLTLVSNASGTASVASGGCSTCSYITGNVNVQRHIPAVARRWRFMGSNVTSATLNDWKQETFITGSGGAANGFDATLSNQASVFSYNEATTGNLNQGWVAATNITNTLTVGRGYRLFVRGDRSSTGRLDGSVTNQNQVTLDLIGTPNQGDVVMPVTYTNANGLADDGWNFLSNPYPSPYDWNAHYDNGSFQSNIEPTIWILNAQTGAYSSFNASSNAGTLTGGIIPSGAGFWVKATGASPSLTFKEQFKVNSVPTGIFKTNEDENFSIRLVWDSITSDEVQVKYMSAATDTFDRFDIIKLASTINVSAYGRDNRQLSLSTRSLKAACDTIRLSISAGTGAYTLLFNNGVQVGVKENVLLVDNYTATVTDLSSTSRYAFNITSDAATSGSNRFYIVVSDQASLPVNMLTFNGRYSGDKQNVVLNWTTVQEVNNDRFEVERSTDGRQFKAIGSVKGKGNGGKITAYQYVDEKPMNAAYYRLKQVDLDGTFEYSDLIYLTNESSTSTLSLYPIPAKEVVHIASDRFSELHSFEVYNAEGKSCLHGVFEGNDTIRLDELQTGMYVMKVEYIDGTSESLKFMKE